MKPSSIKKVFGIISYFPNNDSAYHIETRRERSRRCSELLFKLEELWPDIDIIIIAQNWRDYNQPDIKNNIIRYDYDKLGILGARKELRKKFLESDYDYLIMLDDDGMISTEDPSVYMNIIDEHPDGMGVIRHSDCPLMLLAISKFIYTQIDMPNIDAEQGQGFEDDLFVGTCFTKFPDKCFDFPKDCIEETSFKYHGPGACPSSWAREATRDWNQMRNITQNVIKNLSINQEYTENDFIPQIDAVIPYVDCSDKNWIRDFNKATGIYSTSGPRFRSWNTLKYLFRGIAEYMPFVNRIVLIVARESQVPSWVNRENVRIVFHNEFIPKEFLPTFNSCTIESFLYRISDLSERFVYFNDDIFPTSKLGISDFFDGNTPKINFIEHIKLTSNNIYEQQCRAGLDIVSNALKSPKYDIGQFAKPEHGVIPMLRSTLDKISNLCSRNIPKTISKLRQKHNVNQYIYSYYHLLTQDYIQHEYRFVYADIHDTLSSIRFVVLNSNTQVLCLNDSGEIKDYKKTRQELINIFEEKFPDKCIYEV